jgi:hypothetical protein
MTGSLLFYDKTGWSEILEITENVPVIVLWEEEGIQREKIFIIYDFNKIVEESYMNSGINKTMWYLIEPTFMTLTNKKYSKSWGEGVLNSEIINEISKNMLNIENFEKFENTVETTDNFYMPYWTPAESIQWLMKRSSGETSMRSGYTFFSNSNGYNFITLETLNNDTERERDSAGENVKYIFSGTGDGFNQVLSWYINPPDMMSFKYLGGATKLGYDFKTKDIIEKQYTYKEAIDKYSIFGGSSLFPDISNKNASFTYTADSSEKVIDNLFYDDFIHKYMKQFSVGIVLIGHTRRYAGMIIDISWRSSDEVRKTHKMYEGLYIVRSITHQFTAGVNVTPIYRQLMICMKAGYEMVESKNLVKTNKRISDSYLLKK